MKREEFLIPELRYIRPEDKAALFASLRRQRMTLKGLAWCAAVAAIAIAAALSTGSSFERLIRPAGSGFLKLLGALLGLLASMGVLVIVALFSARRLKPRMLAQLRRMGLCCNCGFNLRGNSSGICPECGAACDHAPPAITGVALSLEENRMLGLARESHSGRIAAEEIRRQGTDAVLLLRLRDADALTINLTEMASRHAAGGPVG